MKTKYFQLLFLVPAICSLLYSCQKDFLKAPTNKALLVPTTLNDFQTLLNNEPVFNVTPGLGEIGADDYYTTNDGWQGLLTNAEKNSYIWAPDIYQGDPDNDWNLPYQQVFYANVVLDGLNSLTRNSANAANYDRIKGSALFFRGHAYYQLAQLFAATYTTQSASSPGIPLRASSETNSKSVRGTLGETYAQVLADLFLAGQLLPVQAAFKTRPGKAAVFGLKARVYQAMQDYSQAKTYADSCLALSHTLTDYNTLDTTSSLPMPSPLSAGDNEVIFYAEFMNYSFLSTVPLTIVDYTLYRSYAANDLRRSLFFTDNGNGLGQFTFRGTYCGGDYVTSGLFAGLATDEVYLIRAESEARNGDTQAALTDLNTLLKTRWVTGTFIPLTAQSADAALQLILQERRKELVSRGTRWTDLRRLNTDPRFAVTLKRLLNGQTYALAPASKLYVLPIPQNEISASGIPQNQR